MSKLRANQLTDKASTGAPTAPNGLVVTGVSTATSFSGSGANLTSLPSAQLTGAVPTTKGGTGLTSLGTAGQALKVNSSGNGLEYGSAGGLVKLASASLTGQNLSSIELEHFSTTYRVYKFFFDGLYFTGSSYPRIRLKKNADNAIQTGSQYSWHTGHPYMQNNGTKTQNVHGTQGGTNWHLHGDNVIHQYWSCAGELTFYNPMAGGTRKAIATWFTVGEESDTNQRNTHLGYGQCLQAEDYKGFQLYPHTNTIAAINYTLYGLAT